MRSQWKVCALTVLAVFATATPSWADYAAEVLADNPVAYWRMNEVYENGGTLINEPGTSAGVAGNGNYSGFNDDAFSKIGADGYNQPGFGANNRAVHFDTFGDLAEVGDAPAFSPGNSLSLEAWIKPDVGGQNGMVVSQYSNSGSQRSFFLLLTDENKLRFSLSPDGTLSDTASFETNQTVAIDAWSHVAVSFQVNQAPSFYLDGSPLTSTSVNPVPLPNDIHDSTLPIRIGSRGDNGNRFDGFIDEVAIYDSTLSASRVKAHFDAAFVPEPASALLLAMAGGALLRRRMS